MLLVVIALVCLAVIPVTGGDLRRLGSIQPRLVPAAAFALLTQIIITEVWTSGSGGLHRALQVVSYLLGGVFVAANLSIPAIPIMALGGVLNLAAITANSGVMPASRWAVAHSGLRLGRGFSNSAPVAHPHLLWLGDIIPVPAGPLSNVLSIGDLVIFAGLLLLLHRTCGRPARKGDPRDSVWSAKRPASSQQIGGS